MIDREVFARVMGGFSDKLGRALAPATFDMYFDVLAAELTSEEFLAGARIVFRSHQYNTWPAPQQFIDAAKPKPIAQLSAFEAFEHVLAIAASPHTLITDRVAKIMALGPAAERAFRAVGGRREFENVLESDVKWLRKTFVEAYEAATSDEARKSDARLSLAAVDPFAEQLVLETVAALPAIPSTTARHRDDS